MMATSKRTYLDLVSACDSFPYDEASLESIYRFFLPDDPRPHGYLLASTVQAMPWTPDFHISHANKTVHLRPVNVATSSSSALATLIHTAINCDTFRIIDGRHSELYTIVGSHPNPQVSIERFFAPVFGIISRGAHLTVYTLPVAAQPRDMKIWVPRRSDSCFTYPNCLDTTVAGGVTAGESPFECVVREAEEEASLPEPLVRGRARACGALSYISLSSVGDGGELGLIAPDLVYVYDLELDGDVVCRPHDGEVKEFNLLNVAEVEEALHEGAFKTNSAVVMLDFFIRHGIITEESEPDYAELLMRMHRKLPFPTSSGGGASSCIIIRS